VLHELDEHRFLVATVHSALRARPASEEVRCMFANLAWHDKNGIRLCSVTRVPRYAHNLAIDRKVTQTPRMTKDEGRYLQ
jgi:hypothetical protein